MRDSTKAVIQRSARRGNTLKAIINFILDEMVSDTARRNKEILRDLHVLISKHMDEMSHIYLKHPINCPDYIANNNSVMLAETSNGVRGIRHTKLDKSHKMHKLVCHVMHNAKLYTIPGTMIYVTPESVDKTKVTKIEYNYVDNTYHRLTLSNGKGVVTCESSIDDNQSDVLLD